MWQGGEYRCQADLIEEYGCWEEHYEELERRKHPSEEEKARRKADEEERKRLGFTKWIAKTRKEAERRMAEHEAEMQRLKRYYEIKASKNKSNQE